VRTREKREREKRKEKREKRKEKKEKREWVESRTLDGSLDAVLSSSGFWPSIFLFSLFTLLFSLLTLPLP